MTYLSDAHTEWHRANGKYATCPVCEANEPFVSECSVCGELSFEWPMDPGNPDVGCWEPATCAAAKTAVEPVTVPVTPTNNPPF